MFYILDIITKGKHSTAVKNKTNKDSLLFYFLMFWNLIWGEREPGSSRLLEKRSALDCVADQRLEIINQVNERFQPPTAEDNEAMNRKESLFLFYRLNYSNCAFPAWAFFLLVI